MEGLVRAQRFREVEEEGQLLHICATYHLVSSSQSLGVNVACRLSIHEISMINWEVVVGIQLLSVVQAI